MKFRPAALRHLEAPEQLDQVVRLASAPAWLMTAVLAVIVAAAVTWATVGTVNTTVGAPGVLIHADGVTTLDAITSGQVARLWVPPGELATSGARLYSVQGTDGRIHTVDAPWDAYVLSTTVAVGQLVEPGTPVADLERVSGTSDPLEAVVFVPAADAPAIQPGKEVTLIAAAVPSAVFGTLRGSVTSVGEFPETTQSLQAFLGDDASTGTYLAAGSVIRIVIKLATVTGAPTELAWSRANPGFALNAESSVQASFVVAAQHPIEWLTGR
jgi:multidrug efflux pump subunit AcrA (membrane-fusion protein)